MNQKDFCTKHCTISGNQYEERRGTDVPVPGELKTLGWESRVLRFRITSSGNYVTLSKSPKFSEPPFPHWFNVLVG